MQGEFHVPDGLTGAGWFLGTSDTSYTSIYWYLEFKDEAGFSRSVPDESLEAEVNVAARRNSVCLAMFGPFEGVRSAVFHGHPETHQQ